MKPPLMSEDEYIEIMRQAFTGDLEDLAIIIKPVEAFMLVSLLQFAHRGLATTGKDFLLQFCETVARQIQQSVAEATTQQINEMMQTGWDPAYDVDQSGLFIDPDLRRQAGQPETTVPTAEAQPQEPAQSQKPQPQIIEVHNIWTIYGAHADGAESEDKLASFGQRPQDWGHSRWVYHRFRFDWVTGDKHYINHAHCWTDLKREDHEYPRLFAPLISQIMMPGNAPELGGRDYLHEEDFWLDEWGQMPPVYEGGDEYYPYPREDYHDYGP